MRGQPKYTGLHSAMVSGVGFQAVEIVEDAATPVIKTLGNLCQRKLAGGAMEQARA